MGYADQQHRLDQALGQMEARTLPDIADMIAALWGAANSIRAGDGLDDLQVGELAAQLDSVRHQIEAISPLLLDPEPHSADVIIAA